MSSNLYWRPTSAGQKLLSDELKHALRKRENDQALDITVNDRDIPYFEGLRDAGIKDAQKLIDAIEKYGSVELKEEW